MFFMWKNAECLILNVRRQRFRWKFAGLRKTQESLRRSPPAANEQWSGLSESNRHLNLGKVREVKSNALERRHLASFGRGLSWKMMENKNRVVPFNRRNRCFRGPVRIFSERPHITQRAFPSTRCGLPKKRRNQVERLDRIKTDPVRMNDAPASGTSVLPSAEYLKHSPSILTVPNS